MDPSRVHKMSVSKNENSIFGELFYLIHLIFLKSLRNIYDGFF